MTLPLFAEAVLAIVPNASVGRIMWCYEMDFSPSYAADWCKVNVREKDEEEEETEDFQDGEPEDYLGGSRGRIADFLYGVDG